MNQPAKRTESQFGPLETDVGEPMKPAPTLAWLLGPLAALLTILSAAYYVFG